MDEARLTRLTEALYRVTDLMSDQEPLKWSLRGKALFVLKLAWKGRSGAIFKSRVEVHERIASVISELLHLLEIASATAHISRINFEVLSREYQSVNGDIQAAKEQKAMFEGVNMVLADQKTHSELNETGAKNREEPKRKGEKEKGGSEGKKRGGGSGEGKELAGRGLKKKKTKAKTSRR